MAKAASDLKNAKDKTQHTAREAAGSPWMERLVRVGYVARGLVYLIPGVLAFELALGLGGAAVNPTGAIEYLGGMPFGKALLILMVIGLLGYSLWGLVRAIYDPFRQGDDPEGLAKRFGYIVSAFGYIVILIATIQYLQGATVSQNNPQDWTAKLMTLSFGRALVGIVGAGWLIGGLYQAYRGFTADLAPDYNLQKMSGQEKKLAIDIGRFGLAGRGVAFALIGVFLIQAAVFANAGRAKGLDGVLLDLSSRPYGQIILAVTALGLVAFGVFSILSARWMRIKLPGRGR